MSTWGISYQGSKSGIAENLIKQLPDGKRLVDLFGGGFAISHCALYSGKYERVLYNELNPLLPPLIKDAVQGKYNYKVFKPQWISKDDFNNFKEQDGYIKYIWSFSNAGKSYLFSEELEPQKHAIHDYIVFNKKNDWFNEYFFDVDKYIHAKDIKARRILWKRYLNILKKYRRSLDLQQLERLERLQQLQQLERLEIREGTYLDYEYQEGDVVYCDPPYEDTASYELLFDHQEFYEWLMSRPYDVYFSSYNNIRDNFKMVWAENKRNQMSGASQIFNYECLYINKRR